MLRIFLILFLSIVIVGCSAANFVVKPYSTLEVKSAHNINPDSNGRPSPVVFYVFELTSDTIFSNQDFFSLYEDPEKVLGPDLVNKFEFSLTPDSVENYQASMNPKTEFIGLVAAFRDIENSNWRQVIKVDKTGYNTYEVLIDDLSLVVK